MIQLYSFRRCPYAIRARWSLALCSVPFEVIEVDLKHKPQAMLALSPKGTVPVLYDGQQVIDESLDIVHWAFDQHLPQGWQALPKDDKVACAIVKQLHAQFVPSLNRFKYASRYDAVDVEHEMQVMLDFLSSFSAVGDGLLGDKTWLDCVCLPLIRQAYKADLEWAKCWPPKILAWLHACCQTEVFCRIMQKA